jgi:hypothetical protein
MSPPDTGCFPRIAVKTIVSGYDMSVVVLHELYARIRHTTTLGNISNGAGVYSAIWYSCVVEEALSRTLHDTIQAAVVIDIPARLLSLDSATQYRWYIYILNPPLSWFHPAWHNWLARETFTIIVISRLRVRASPWELYLLLFFWTCVSANAPSGPLPDSWLGNPKSLLTTLCACSIVVHRDFCCWI